MKSVTISLTLSQISMHAFVFTNKQIQILKVSQARQLSHVVVYCAEKWKLIMLQHSVLKTTPKKLAESKISFSEFSLHPDVINFII